MKTINGVTYNRNRSSNPYRRFYKTLSSRFRYHVSRLYGYYHGPTILTEQQRTKYAQRDAYNLITRQIGSSPLLIMMLAKIYKIEKEKQS